MRRTKYNAVRCNGYASIAESQEAAKLKILADRGIITDYREQVPFELLPAGCGYKRALRYVADFCWKENGVLVIADKKGFRTPVYLMKKRLMRQLLGLEILEL